MRTEFISWSDWTKHRKPIVSAVNYALKVIHTPVCVASNASASNLASRVSNISNKIGLYFLTNINLLAIFHIKKLGQLVLVKF